jgi:predicted ATP-grasp superfamily ATP-dependent carboligase
MTGIIRMYAATILIYEFFSGGGCPEGDLPSGLAAEALGMLSALLEDFRRWGAIRTVTALDPRFGNQIPGLNRISLPADEIVPATPGRYEDVFLSALKRCDVVLVLAPETNGILSRLISMAENSGKPVLGSSASAAEIAGNKAACDRIFRHAKLSIPKTLVVTFASAQQEAKNIGCPFVVKPIDGIGSEGVCRVDSLADLPAILSIVRKVTVHDQILLQAFAEGIHASVSLLTAKGRSLSLSLNRQLITAGAPFQYYGSQVPFAHHLSIQAQELACSAVELIPGLNGYLGVDMVLTEEGVRLIEINPRLTTSYVGLRQVAQSNLAQAIWEACMEGKLPDSIPLIGQVVIKKDGPDTWGLRPKEDERL